MKTGHMLYSDLVPKGYMGSEKLSWEVAELLVLNSKIGHFTDILMDNFAEHCNTEFLILSSTLLDHEAEDLCRFGTLDDLEAVLFDHLMCILRHYIE